MANALKNPTSERPCLEYFGLEQSPFACLPETSPAFRTDQYSLLEARLAETMSDTDCLLVLRGADGSGKTTLLKRFLAARRRESLFALIDESCRNGNDFYCSFLRQMGFEDISGKLKELRTIAREFLVHRATAGNPVPLVFDNAPRIRYTVLEQLRWVAGIENNDRRVLSVVITGNSALEGILDSPAMTDLRFRDNKNFHVRAFTEEETGRYVEHRLQLAGAKDKLEFTPAARRAVHRFSGGLPGAINRIGSLLLIEATNRETHTIDDSLVLDVAEAEQLPVNVIPLEARGRRKTDAGTGPVAPDADPAGLHDRIAELTAKVRELEAEKAETDDMVESQNVDVGDLRDSLAAQMKETEELTSNIKSGVREISELRKKLASNEESLRRSASDAKKLAADSKKQAAELRKEKRSAKSAQAEADRTKRKISRLEKTKSGLQDKVKELRGDLRDTKKKASQLSKTEIALEKSEAKLDELQEFLTELEELRNELASRDATIDELTCKLAVFEDADTKDREQPDAVPDDDPLDELVSDAQAESIIAFEVVRDGKTEQVFEVDLGNSRIMVGREDDSDLRLQSEFVSRHHALLFCKPWETYVEDLKSFNGTLVNGEAVSRRRLEPGDVVLIGDFILRPLTAD